MIVFAAISSLVFGQVASPPRITAVSMFKNGYSFVAHETRVTGSGEYLIEQPPQAAYGTFWHLPSAGISIKRATVTTVDRPSNSPVASLEALLDLNTGKQVTVDFSDLPSIKGTLMRSLGDQLVIKGPEGVEYVNKDRIKRVLFSEDPTTQVKSISKARVLSLDVEAKQPGTISTVGLERGLTWLPSYSLDISDGKELQLVGKATIINELADLDNVSAGFITGFPNVPYSNVLDPLISNASLDTILQPLIDRVSFDATDNSLMVQKAAKDEGQAPPFVPAGTGEQREDLYVYQMPGVSLKKGDRATYVLFALKTPYDHLYTWDVSPSSRGADEQYVWHSLTFKNTSGKPLTTAVATTFQNGQLLGQSTLDYTTAGADAEVQITRAMDIHAEAIEEEVSRDRASLHLPGGSTYDLITMKGTLTATNHKSTPAKMRISVSFAGDLSSVDGSPKVTKGVKGLGELNTGTGLEWRPEVRPGGTLKLTYSYRMYARTP
jgi:hypothetical protein